MSPLPSGSPASPAKKPKRRSPTTTPRIKPPRTAPPTGSPLHRVAQAFARGTDIDRSLRAGLRVMQHEIGAQGCSIWLNDAAGARKFWATGHEGLTADAALVRMSATRAAGGSPFVARLRVGKRVVGLLAVGMDRTLKPAQRELVDDVAGVLGPILMQTERARELELTVAAGNREIETQRAFFERDRKSVV